MSRAAAVALVAFGLACVSVALGLIYIDFQEREGRWLEVTARAQARGKEPDADDMAPWFDHGRAYVSLGFGTAGVAALGSGLMTAMFHLRVFHRSSAGE